MSPIRVGLIGLSGAPSDKYQGGGWAAMGHLPYLFDSDDYTLAALCNTSVESAKNAVKLNNLPEYTKTYGSVEGKYFAPSLHAEHRPCTLTISSFPRTRCRSGYRPRRLVRPRRQTLPDHRPRSPCRKSGLCRVAARSQSEGGKGDGRHREGTQREESRGLVGIIISVGHEGQRTGGWRQGR